jgi:hypothetical protein
MVFMSRYISFSRHWQHLKDDNGALEIVSPQWLIDTCLASMCAQEQLYPVMNPWEGRMTKMTSSQRNDHDRRHAKKRKSAQDEANMQERSAPEEKPPISSETKHVSSKPKLRHDTQHSPPVRGKQGYIYHSIYLSIYLSFIYLSI